jgi:4-diphosphocytidyl-2-C-methyl-D-erythritol kinase
MQQNPGVQHAGVFFCLLWDMEVDNMRYTLSSDGKLNLTLRITEKRGDGYHNLVSLFLRLPAMESLTISTYKDNNVREIATTGHIVIDGKNIVEKTIECLESKGWSLPGLHVALAKQIPPGTGLGAGSGNAASFLRWARLFEGSEVTSDILEKIGSDVSFLYSRYFLSLVVGKGEKSACRGPLPPMQIVVAIPGWGVSTSLAYAGVDAFYGVDKGGSFPCNEWTGLAEVEKIYQSLLRGENVGFLPNDFYPWLAEQHPEYEAFFNECESSNALGYGLSGSGSSVFALFPANGKPVKLSQFEKMEWIQQILFWSDDR